MVNPAELASKFESLLNDNVLGTKYRLFYWVQDLDRRFEKVDGVNEQFIPAMIISNSGRYRPIPGAGISDEEFIISIFYPQKYKNDVMIGLDRFKTLVVGQKITVGVIPNADTIICNMDVPLPGQVDIQQLKELNELDNRLNLDESQMYGRLQIRIYYVVANGFLMGNDVAFSLKKTTDSTYTELTRVDGTIQNTKVLSSEQMIDDGTGAGKKTSESIAQANSTNEPLTIYYNENVAFLVDIVTDLANGTNQNRVYDFKVAIGTKITITKKVIVQSATFNAPLGNVCTISLVFDKAWSEL